ncbi:hypothetical protein ED733_005455 [Metarhizium rileyi]|uniref:RhoGAP domain protein n=1 Tax=Metarhizium rileyi (strain RCEF 4871) TaxID=1649241 RepID=A0A5C6GN04_METRR|nr:hypothetical protein ED733_005455 [Metarhizium rileyi]
MRAVSGQQDDLTGLDAERGPISPQSPRSHPGIQTNGPLDSPGTDSERPKDFAINIPMAPYPITPPADKPYISSTAVGEMLDPKATIPEPEEHASDNLNHEAEDRVAGPKWKEKDEQRFEGTTYNASLPPSQSCSSEPPKIPPPKVPATTPSVEPSPDPDQGLSQFPSPPRKPPPAPLQLKQQGRTSPATAATDSDSDYDDILQVDGIAAETRGRRKTREDDDKERQANATKQAEEHSTSNAGPESPIKPKIQHPSLLSQSQNHDKSTALKALLLAERKLDVAVPLLSPGLPATPRLLGNIPQSASAPVSARLTGASTPLSPRPPRPPIAMSSNTPLISPVPPSSTSSLSVAPLNAAKHGVGASQSSPTERTRIYKGLVTEEYPDLLLPPNALPSIKVKVASSRMKPSRASLMSLTQLEEDPVFTLAVISRADGGELWRVEKDIASLSKLDSRLKQCPACTARTPDRTLFTGHAPAKLDARRAALEEYMVDVLDTPFDVVTAVEMCKYLSTNTLPPNADETGSSFRPTPERSSRLKIGADDRPRRSGYLTKKGKNFGGWKARFFVLEGPEPEFKYYETPGGAHHGTIRLRNAQIGKQSQTQTNENQSPAQPATGEDLDNNQFRHAILIMEHKKRGSSAYVKHILCAESDKERDAWIDVLLQWIDYQDADDENRQQPPPQSAKAPRNQQPSGSDPPSSIRPKKTPPSKTQHKQANSDTLIGVRYDATHAGEAPQKGSAGNPEQHSSHNLAGETLSTQANKMISAPKDAEIISDPAVWGNRAGLGVSTHDEKKQRKRSFFRFGPKTRTSSDGQDSLFGGSDAGSASAVPSSYGQRELFGASLVDAVRYYPPVDVKVPLPSVVYRCIQYLDHHDAINEEGIFRLSGSSVVIRQLRERFIVEGDVNLVADEQYHDIHAVASLLKLYLRDLPTSILTSDLHQPFFQATEISDCKEKIAKMKELGQRLPRANATLLKYLIAFLIRVINKSDINKMTVRNVGIVFSPTLHIPGEVFATFLQNYESIFGINPEEYELPSPAAESNIHGQADAPAQRKEPAPPSISSSGGSASSHPHLRLDGRREYSRSTPTPPLMSNVQGHRSNPTPPPLQYGGATRPAYESGYGLPNGFDGHGCHPAQRTAPGYDRPILQSSSEEHGAGETHQRVNAKRRESSIYMGVMGGLQQQGSKSRLREEASLF